MIWWDLGEIWPWNLLLFPFKTPHKRSIWVIWKESEKLNVIWKVKSHISLISFRLIGRSKLRTDWLIGGYTRFPMSKIDQPIYVFLEVFQGLRFFHRSLDVQDLIHENKNHCLLWTFKSKKNRHCLYVYFNHFISHPVVLGFLYRWV